VIVFINIVLAVFNLIPIPPLDGSKVLYALFPARFRELRDFFERYGFILVLLFIFFLWRFIFPVALGLFRLITGFLPM
jgi:Zn-dependent protease